MKYKLKDNFYLLLFFMIAPFFLHLEKAEAKEVDWAAINPDIKDTAKCFECHEDYICRHLTKQPTPVWNGEWRVRSCF